VEGRGKATAGGGGRLVGAGARSSAAEGAGLAVRRARGVGERGLAGRSTARAHGRLSDNFVVQPRDLTFLARPQHTAETRKNSLGLAKTSNRTDNEERRN